MDIHRDQKKNLHDFGVKFCRNGKSYSRTKVIRSIFESFFCLFDAHFYEIKPKSWGKMRFCNPLLQG